jgi:hypothetical protein
MRGKIEGFVKHNDKDSAFSMVESTQPALGLNRRYEFSIQKNLQFFKFPLASIHIYNLRFS